MKDKPDELRKVQENRAFTEKFKKEPISDGKKWIKGCGKNVNVNAVLKFNIANWNVFTMDNLCDMHCSWLLARLQKYLKKKSSLDFNWMWMFILIFLGIGGLIVVIMFVLPSIANVI